MRHIVNYVLPLLFLGKFYFLVFGSVNHLKPKAPLYIIFLKDMLIAALYIGVLLLVRKEVLDKHSTFIKRFLACFFAFFAICMLHLVRMPTHDWLQHYGRNVIFLLPFIAIGYLIADAKLERRMGQVIYWMTLVLSALAIIQTVLFPGTLWHDRTMLFFADPITFGGFLSVGIIFSLIHFPPNQQPEKQVLYFLGLLLALLALFTTKSLTFIGATAVCIYVFGLIRNRLTFAITSAATVALLFLALAFYDNPSFKPSELPGFLEKVAIIAQDPWSHSTFMGRVKSYMSFSNFVLEAPASNVILGDLMTSTYHKLDFSIGGMVKNFGALGTLILLLPLLFIMFKSLGLYFANRQSALGNTALMSFFVGFCFLLASFANSMVYRYPLNVVLYLYCGIMLYLIGSDKRLETTHETQ